MANYHKRNSIRAVQWAPENAQSFEDIKKLIAENPGIGWKHPISLKVFASGIRCSITGRNVLFRDAGHLDILL